MIWLVTDVLEPQELTTQEAHRFYAKRWPASECTFRTWKGALDAGKLDSRTPELAEREAEFSLCTLMLLQVSVYWARHRKRLRRSASVAQAQRVWRKALRALVGGRARRTFREDLANCRVDGCRRRRPKASRPWPARKEHNQAKAPKLRRLDARLKALGHRRLAEAACCPI